MNYRLFHGSTVKGLTSLRPSSSRSFPVIYFSDEPNVAATYAHGGKVYPATVTMNRPMVVDAKGRDWENAGGRNVSTDALAARAYAQGHDGIIIHNVVDEVDEEGYPVPDAPPNNIYAVFDAAQVKLTRRNPAVTGRGTGRGGTADAGDSKSPGHRGRVGSSPTAPTIRRNSVAGAFSHDEGADGTGVEIVGTYRGEPVGSIAVYGSATSLNQNFSSKALRFVGLPRGKVGYLGGIELPVDARGSGHGAAIVEAMLAEARRMGVKAVALHSEKGGAQKFWAKMGFVERAGVAPANWWQPSLPHMIRVLA